MQNKKTLGEAELNAITERTLCHYDTSARDFWLGTKDHDVTQNIDALLAAIEAPPPCVILDFGCGPGRDLIELSRRGHRAVGLDGSLEFVRMARDNSGCEVLHQDFLSLKLPEEEFDGVFANASLFHVPRQVLPSVLRRLYESLKRNGILFASNPRGDDQEGWSGDRFGCFHSLEAWRRFGEGAGFVEISHYYRPEGKPRHEQPWLATVWRKPPV